MTKRVIIVHGWDGTPDSCWYPWLKQALEQQEFTVDVPAMPDTEHPKITEWVNHLNEVVGTPNENTYFIGHSIGCQTILRYLQTLPENTIVGGVLFVAGWVHLTPESFPDTESEHIATPWMNTSLDWEKIRKHTTNITAIFSDNDPFVPLTDAEIFKENLNANIIKEQGKGHYSDDTFDDATEFPSILNAFLKLTS